jgi:hypothetical protein
VKALSVGTGPPVMVGTITMNQQAEHDRLCPCLCSRICQNNASSVIRPCQHTRNESIAKPVLPELTQRSDLDSRLSAGAPQHIPTLFS